jgi:hypothetical protein
VRENWITDGRVIGHWIGGAVGGDSCMHEARKTKMKKQKRKSNDEKKRPGKTRKDQERPGKTSTGLD